MVEATLHQLNIATNLPNDEPAHVAVPVSVHQVSGRLPTKEPPSAPRVDYDVSRCQIDTGAAVCLVLISYIFSMTIGLMMGDFHALSSTLVR